LIFRSCTAEGRRQGTSEEPTALAMHYRELMPNKVPHWGEGCRVLMGSTFLGATGVFGSCFCLSLSAVPGGGAFCSGGRITGLPTSTGFISGPGKQRACGPGHALPWWGMVHGTGHAHGQHWPGAQAPAVGREATHAGAGGLGP
jgi:hypothetical protein